MQFTCYSYRPALLAGALGLLMAGGAMAAAQTAAPMKLSALDYIEIEQLSARYAFAIEECTNHGYDYADLYTDDGYFSVSPAWGEVGKKYAEGREALARVDGGTPEGCKDPKTMMGYGITHIIVDLVITPIPTGAKGRSILIALGVGGNPTTVERQGGYEDVYVKTPKGWRIKARAHVFPNMAESVQFGHPGAKPAAPSQAASRAKIPEFQLTGATMRLPKISLIPLAFLALCASSTLAQAPAPGPRPFSIERLDPALDVLIAPGSKAEMLVDDFGLTEGPVWVPEGTGYLAFSDLTANVIYKWVPSGTVSVLLEKAGYSGNDITSAGTQTARGRVAVLMIGPNGETIDRQGRLIYCASPDGTVVRLEKDGSRTILADKYEGKRFNGPNDVVSKSDGAIIFTDSDFGLRGGKNSPQKELQFNGVFLVRGDRKAKLLIKDAELGGFTNGIALSPDEKYLYLSSGFKKMMRYELKPDDTLGEGTVLFEGGTGIADGMKTDLKGNLYSTGGAGPGEIRITSPEGKHLGTIHMPIPAGEPKRQICATNVAFGESDGKSLFITACEALYRIRVSTAGIRAASSP